MWNKSCTLVINLPDCQVMTALYPISRGPGGAEDILMLMDDLCGRAYVIRADNGGKHLFTSPKVKHEDGLALVKKMLSEQGTKDYNEVTCNGRYGCD